MRKKLRFVVPTAVIAAAALTLIGYSSAGENSRAASDTLVYGASADPAYLDPSLTSDGESLRPVAQIFESLVGFKPGTSTPVPALATAWRVSKNHLAWTFTLRKGVVFSDGTPFNAAAVCFNFTRWYHFPAPLQSDALSYYWQTVFGGFANPAPGALGPDKSLYKGCKTHGQYSVSLLLQRPSTSFLSAIGLPSFGIASPTALRKYQADAGTIDSTGVFHPTGTFATQHPIGTGPYMLQSWQPGNKLVLVANPKYRGPKPKINRIIYIPIGDSAARLQAFQSGELQAYDNVGPQDFATIRGNKKYKLHLRPPTSLGYVGINQSIPPMNNPLVRQAVAYGLNGAAVAKAFYGGAGTPATQFLPPSLAGYAKKGVPAYPVQPGEVDRAPEAGGADTSGEGRLLVPDQHLPPVHARSAAELRGVRGEPGQGRLQRRGALGAVASRLPRAACRRARTSCSCTGGTRTSSTRRTTSTSTSGARRRSSGSTTPRCSRCSPRRTPSRTSPSAQRCTSWRVSR